MASHQTTVTRKGQITIPIDIRRELGLAEGDRLTVELQGETFLVRRAISVAERTSDALSRYRRTPPLSPEAERTAFADAVAEEVAS